MDVLNEDKLMKQAKEIWEKSYKKLMTWEKYWTQIKEQFKIYHAIPDCDKSKFTNMLMTRVHRTDRAIQKLKSDRLK